MPHATMQHSPGSPLTTVVSTFTSTAAARAEAGVSFLLTSSPRVLAATVTSPRGPSLT